MTAAQQKFINEYKSKIRSAIGKIGRWYEYNKKFSFMEFIWLFNGEMGRFASAVFTELSLAEDWIKTNKLTGVLTKYPINIGVYDWAIKEGIFSVKKEDHTTAQFIGRFTSAGQEHYHYENGEKD